jgi:hypothetical protein
MIYRGECRNVVGPKWLGWKKIGPICLRPKCHWVNVTQKFGPKCPYFWAETSLAQSVFGPRCPWAEVPDIRKKKWTKTDPRAYQRWDQEPRGSKHPHWIYITGCASVNNMGSISQKWEKETFISNDQWPEMSHQIVWLHWANVIVFIGST